MRSIDVTRLRPTATRRRAVAALSALVFHASASPSLGAEPVAQTEEPTSLLPDPPSACRSCDDWNAARPPFQVYGNTWFVGPAGVSALLLTSDEGHILVDAGLPQSATAIDASIRALGFETTDVRLILTSHAHFDHVGGVRALQRYTGAEVVGSPQTARALAIGSPTPDDPQAPPGPPPGVDYFPAVPDVRAVTDGEVVRVGPLAVTAHHVPGHTPGATTWTWQSCEGARCLNVVYADSLSTVSNEGFRFTGDADHPNVVPGFRASIQKVATLPCDLVISTHPEASNMDAKLKERADRKPGDPDPFVDPSACESLAAAAMRGLEDRIRTESAKPSARARRRP